MGKKSYVNSTVFDSLIGSKSTIEGNVNSSGGLRIDGIVNGDISLGGDLFVGKTAIVRGGISAGNIELAGSIEGNVTGRGVLKLHASSKLKGDVEVASFIADEGAVFQGNCKMREVNKEIKKEK